MKFAEHYEIERTARDDWFDPILTLDTKLFIDPFLLYDQEAGHFDGCHAEVIAFFNSVFKMIAKARGDRRSLPWRRASSLLLFPEAEELCLGYTSRGTRGSGSGSQLSTVIAEALWEAIRAGVQRITHFEEIRILREGIGADRISDITAGLIRAHLAQYTRSICRRHRVACVPMNYLRGVYVRSEGRWMPREFLLPRNPYNGKPILLVPRRYLRSLPSVDPDDFWEYCYDNANETIRNEYSSDVTRNVDKKTIIEFARRHPDLRATYLRHLESAHPSPYDLASDPRGLYRWYDSARDYCADHPLKAEISTLAGLQRTVDLVIEEFARFVKDNRGWKLLWNDNGRPKPEEAVQLLFLGTVAHYCRANDIDVTPEADIGRGPVDFKVSRGHHLRAHIEVKLASNSRFWNGLERQLPTYMRTEGVRLGHFLVVVQSQADLRRLSEIGRRVAAVREATGLDITHHVVDARRGGAPSASRL